MDQQGQTTAVEHTEWVGAQYEAALQGQGIAVVRFSHWGDAVGEHPNFTCDMISKVREGTSAKELGFSSSRQ